MLDPRELARRKAAEADREPAFSKARQLLADLIALPDLQAVLDGEHCVEAKPVYTQAPTLVLLILQRLGGGLSLTAAVQELIKHHADLLPRNRRVEEGTLSENNSAYNTARQKLPLQQVEAFSNAICNHLAARSEPVWQGRRVMILDGTTITLPPTPALKKAFPPATNQHGESVWPVMLMLVAHEMVSSCALPPEIGAMYGANNTSEGKLAKQIAKRLPFNSVVMADIAY